MELEIKVAKLEKLYKELDSRILEVEGYRNPQSLNGRLESTCAILDDVIGQMTALQNKFQSFCRDDKFAEIFTDEEIRELYANSGLSSMDVKLYIEKNFTSGEPVSMMTVSNYTTGAIKDIMTRSLMGRYFRYEGIKTANKVKK